jgi:predicted XRE-type DNA-binding protein
MSRQRFDSVWDAIEDTPEEAENMKLRSALMTALKSHISRSDMSQAKAAKLFGVTQLVNMATAAGLHVEMRILERADSNA